MSTFELPRGRPESSGRLPASWAIRSHADIALIINDEPPTTPKWPRNRRRLTPENIPEKSVVFIEKAGSHYRSDCISAELGADKPDLHGRSTARIFHYIVIVPVLEDVHNIWSLKCPRRRSARSVAN